MNKFNQWFATAPIWQFLCLLIAEILMVACMLHALQGWSIMISVL